jgi:hypothetical protein
MLKLLKLHHRQSFSATLNADMAETLQEIFIRPLVPYCCWLKQGQIRDLLFNSIALGYFVHLQNKTALNQSQF